MLWFSTLHGGADLVVFAKLMYLKNLTVLGFKSFADKTSLNFQPGVTAIVGPNGCGKSNVSDAIRWVLGEQSAKALRGGEMADVIFNGTDGRKPMGMGEVSLTLGGVDQDNLRAAGVEVAFNEVTVTRRIFRDGGSEYFVNRVPCRLKDIQQLFMGTGLGRTSYSIMAQGHITQILSSKPEDRRMIFEEAAGITKFKSQKKETLRKLEYTDQNLLRVADLIREVKRQIGSLQRQAGKAKRYKQLSAELQHLDTQLARHQLDVLLGEIRDKQSVADALRNEIETGSANVLRHEDEIGELRQRLSELEQEISITQQRGLELKSELDRHESRIQFNENACASWLSRTRRPTRTSPKPRNAAGSPRRTRQLAAAPLRFRSRAQATTTRPSNQAGRPAKDRRPDQARPGIAPAGAGRCLRRRAGFDPRPQRNQRARFAEAGQRRPARKTFRGKGAA
jgi:chromosome segregation protein